MTVAPANPSPPSNKAALFTVFFVIFIDLLGFGIVLPLLPRYAANLLSPAGIPDHLHGLTTGALFAVFSLMQFVFAPIWGRVSDRIGRRPILLLGLAGSVVFYSLFGFASASILSDGQMAPDVARFALLLMFIARIGAGIAGATISTAQAVIADSTSQEKRAHGMALIGMAFGGGFTFGPLLGGAALIFAPDHPQFAGYFAAGLSLVAWLLAMFKLPETLKRDNELPPRGWLDVRGLYSTLQTPTVGILVLTFFLATFGFAKFESTLSLLTKEIKSASRPDGYTDQDNFWIFTYVGFVFLLAAGYSRQLLKKLPEIKLMRLGVGSMFLGLAGLTAVALSDESALRSIGFFISLALGVTGFAFLTPSSQALISKRSDPNRQGEVLGVNQSFSSLARILGPIVGITLFFVPGTHHVLPYVASAVMLVIVIGLLTRIKRN